MVLNIANPPELVAIDLWLDLELIEAILFFLIKKFWKIISRITLKEKDEMIITWLINDKIKDLKRIIDYNL